MNTVWKYTWADPDVRHTWEIPMGATVVHVDWQAGAPRLWFHLDTGAPTVERTFLMAGTGHPIELDDDERVVHVGSLLTETPTLPRGEYVFHFFEIVPALDRPF